MSNDILVLNPNDGPTCGNSLNITGSDNVAIVLKVLTDAGMSIEQASGVAGNFVVESGSEKIDPAAEEFDGQDKGGKGIVQWTGVRWRGEDGLREFSKYKGTDWSDLNTQLEFMLWEVGKGNPWNGKPGGAEKRGWNATLQETTTAGAAETWMLTYERPGVPHLDRRKSAAESILAQYSSSDQQLQIDASVTTNSDGCTSNSNGSAVNGDIVTTAKNFAWPHRVAISKGYSSRHGESAAKPEYVNAVESIHKSITDAIFTDCGVFISTVMRASGVDPDYPLRGTGVQLPYVKNSSKYKTFTATSESELQPGDILIRTGHTYMYVGPYTSPEDGKEYKAVGASWHTRPPSGHSLYLSGNSSSDISSSSSFTVARYIGG